MSPLLNLLLRISTFFLLARPVFSQGSRLGNPVAPKSRALHSAVILQKELMVIYGGIDGSATDPYKAQALTDTYVFNITSKLWYKPNIKNAPSKGAKFHSAANYNNSNTMHVFTGPSGLVSLDTNSWEWTSPIPAPSQISDKLGATMVASGNSLILYGGVEFGSDGAPDTSKVSDAVYTYELTSRKWFLMPNGNKLYFHSSCYAPGQTEEIIFGGATSEGTLTASVIALSMSAFQFYLNRVSSQAPPQLIGSTLTCIGPNGILMGGGDLDWKPTSAMIQIIGNAGGANPEFLWSQAPIKDSGMAPGPRIGHSAAVLGKDIYIYGGVGANDINVYKLSTTTWEWDILSSPSAPASPNSPTNPNSNSGTSRNTQVIIIAIVSALFGVLMMGVIIAVCLRHWRQKSRILKKDSASGLVVDSMYRGPETRAWADSNQNTPVRYSSYSATTSNLDVRRTPAMATPTLHLEEEECWTVGETTSYSVLSGQDDAASSVAPVRYLRPLSPLSPHRTAPNENFLPRPYPQQSEEGLAALQSTSDVVSPLDRIARLHTAMEEQELPTHSTSELSTPTSSIQNWPFLAQEVLPLSRESILQSQLSLSSNSHVVSPTHPAGLDSILHKRLSAKYRITASSLVMPRGTVSVVQATEISSLAPVAILLYRNKYDWDRDCEMLQILEGPFAPRLKESFQVPSAGKTHYVLVQERLGTPLPDILRRQTQPFSDLDLRLLIKGMARVLDFCHSRGVVLVDFQPTDLAFSPDPNSSRLMLARVESCHIEGDKFHRDAPSRYCSPELAAAFLDGTYNTLPALPFMDLWALGCLIYELYSRKPVIGLQTTEEETLEKLANNSLELIDLDAIPSEATQAVQALLQLRGEDRQSASQILDLPLLSRCPSRFSLLATLPQPVPPRFRSGDLDHKSASAIVALRRQVVATSEIQVPRLVIVLPSLKASRTWTNPDTWDADTFHVHFLCEGAPGMHFTDTPALTLSDPKVFFSQAGLLVATTSQLCSLYMSPEFLGELDAPAANSIMTYGTEPDAYFKDLAKVLEGYCASYGSEPAIMDAARSLQRSRPANIHTASLDSWITQWTSSARDALTSTRHIALQEVRLLIQGGYESPDPSLVDFTGLVYSRQLPPLSPGAPSIPQPRWHAWLCSTHTQQPSLPQA